jgi:LPS-assembly lipoprotein
MRRRTMLAAAVAPTALAACGFELRRTPYMAFKSIALVGFTPRSPLGDQLRRALEPSVRVIDQPARAEVVLEAMDDLREKGVVASTAAAQVRELQLRVRLRLRLSTPAGRSLIAPSELLQTRDMSYTETAALAKEQEEQQLYRVMEGDIVQQVLRRLAAVTEI